MFPWFFENRLFQLVRSGARTTHIILVIALALAVTLFSQMAAVPVVVALVMLYGMDAIGATGISLPGEPAAVTGFWMGAYLIASFFLIFVFLEIWTRFFERRPLASIGYERKGALAQYGRGLLLGLLMFGGAVGIMALTGNVAFEDGDPAQQGLVALAGVALVFFGWMVQGAAEEALTRGWVLPVLSVRYRPWVGVLVSSLIFAVFHGLNPNLSLIALLNLSLFGLFAALYAMREGSLWGISALHSVWNWVQGNVFGFEVSGSQPMGGTLLNLMETGPDWLTGGAFGPEGGVAVTAVLVMGLLVVLFWKKA